MKGLSCILLCGLGLAVHAKLGDPATAVTADNSAESNSNSNRGLQQAPSVPFFQSPGFFKSSGNGPPVCTYEPDEFQADVVVEFLGHPEDVTAESIQVIQDSFTEVYNEIAGGNCDRAFRTVGEVQVQSESSSGGEVRRDLQGLNNGGNRRPKRFSFRLLVLGNCRGCKKDALLFNDGIRRRRLEDEDAMHMQQARDLLITGAQYGGQVFMGRPIDHPSGGNFNFFRNPFDCSCEISPAPGADRSVEDVEFNDVFDGQVVAMNAAGTLPGIQRSLGVSQVVEVNCTDQDDAFDSEVFVDATGDPDNITEAELRTMERLFLDAYRSTSDETCDEFFRVVTDVVGTIVEDDGGGDERSRALAQSLLSRVGNGGNDRDRDRDRENRDYTAELEALQQALDDAVPGIDVNSISQADTNNNNAAVAESDLPSAVSSSPRFRPFRFRFQVTGKCKGCRSDARLFNDGFRRRMSEEQQQYEVFLDAMGQPRRLGWVLNGDTCFCRVGVPEGPPEQAQFSNTYNEVVQAEATAENSTLTNVGIIQDVIQVNPEVPSSAPSGSPSLSSDKPSTGPSQGPSNMPSRMPSVGPSHVPSTKPSSLPTPMPSASPSAGPTVTASMPPTVSQSPTEVPVPTESPVPSPSPSWAPTESS